MLGVEAGEPLALVPPPYPEGPRLGQGQEVPGVPLADPVGQARTLQLLPAVLAQRLQELVAGPDRVVQVGHHQ